MKVCNYCGGSIAEQLVGRLNAESVAFMRDRYQIECAALRAQVASLAAALRQYADPMNWGYRDESGYPKGYGEYEDACFIGRDVAVAAIAAAEGGTK